MWPSGTSSAVCSRGVAYQHFGPKGVDNPDLMWILFAALAASTAVMLVIYNKFVLKGATS